MIMNAVAGLALKGGHCVPEPPPAPSPEEPAPIVSTRIDFPAYNLPEYADSYAVVIDNLFTREDCVHLLSFTPEVWPEATIDESYIDTSYRNSGRFVRDEPELAAWILAKIRPYLHEIETVPETHANWQRGVWRYKGKGEAPPPPTMSSLRTDLRFLRYGPGHFFKPHGDVTHVSDLNEVSYYTVQIYLNGDSEHLMGGATRFWPEKARSKKNWWERKVYLDVEPRMGRVLVFQQGNLIHSGEPVTKGIKYNIRADLMYKSRNLE